MNKLPMLCLSTVLLASQISYADTSSDSHGISITVPEVRLLNIKSAPGGSGGSDNSNVLSFEKDSTHYLAKGYYDITANVKAGTSNTRSIMVTANGIGKDWKLSIESGAFHSAVSVPVTLKEGNNSAELVNQVSNVAMRDIELSYKLEPVSPVEGNNLSFPDQGIELTFTLTDEI
jgi:hypothetical protein